MCALSVDNDKNYIAYPGSSQNGEVQVFDAINLVCLKKCLYYSTSGFSIIIHYIMFQL